MMPHRHRRQALGGGQKVRAGRSGQLGGVHGSGQELEVEDAFRDFRPSTSDLADAPTL